MWAKTISPAKHAFRNGEPVVMHHQVFGCSATMYWDMVRLIFLLGAGCLLEYAH